MSFARSFEEARAIQNAIQCDKTDGMEGGSSSPILHGSATSGVTESVSMANRNVQANGHEDTLTPTRTNVKVRTGSLTRKYASTGS